MYHYTAKVEGHREKDLNFMAQTSCGSIEDGVAFSHGKQGGFIISYDDLLEMVAIATHLRLPCSFDGCPNPRISIHHTYCLEHRRHVAYRSWSKNTKRRRKKENTDNR
jgi:hypothetical protein